jgi:hypothetical protein
MTTDEAKFILSAFRPSGSDAGNAAFCDALRMAGEDPVLGAWFAQSRAHDAAVAGKLRGISPPAGLREAVLAGVRMSGTKKSSAVAWGWFGGLAAAAAVAVGLFTMRASAHADSAASALAGFAIHDMVSEKHGGRGEATGALVAQLQAAGSRMPGADQIDFARLKDTGCRTLNFAGHDVLEVCFVRDGSLFHLYMTRRDGTAGSSIARGPSLIAEAAGAAAVWSDTRFDYALASTAGVEAIRRLL